jgi:hypothetical protein
MSTPLFERTVTNGSGTAAILGASLAAYSGATTMVDLTAVQDEPMLIDEIAYCAEKFSTLDGELLLALVDGSGNRRLVGAYDIPAGSASLMASGRIALNLVIEAGFKLVAAHNVTIAGPTFVNVHVVPLGGIVR